jgi:hypothetical protein
VEALSQVKPEAAVPFIAVFGVEESTVYVKR